jgi:hypothetical protein
MVKKNTHSMRHSSRKSKKHTKHTKQTVLPENKGKERPQNSHSRPSEKASRHNIALAHNRRITHRQTLRKENHNKVKKETLKLAIKEAIPPSDKQNTLS